MALGSISGYSSRSSYPDYGKIASGNRINSASDDAAGLAIAQKQDSQIRGYNASANNLAAGRDALNIADGAMSGVADYVQRIRELAVQAGNGTMSDSDRKIIQDEINQMKQGINDITGQAKYNTTRLLDGSQSSLDLYATGGRRSAGLGSTTTAALGLDGFDVTNGNFDISILDDILNKLSSTRSSIGASTNGLDSSISYLQNSSYNTTAAYSRKSDLDIASAVSDVKKKETLQQYRTSMQRKQMENLKDSNKRMFSTMF